MRLFRRVPKGFNLDRELEQAERDVWRAMFESTQKMKPDDAFARRLESKLRSQARASQSSRRASIRPLTRRSADGARPLTPLPRGTQAPKPGRFVAQGRLFSIATMGMRFAVLLIVVLGMAVLWRGGLRPSANSSVVAPTELPPPRPFSELLSEFLPPGKVRHLIIEHSYTPVVDPAVGGSPQVTKGLQEVWLTAGEEHPLMRSVSQMSANLYSITDSVGRPDGFWTVPVLGHSVLIDDDHIFETLPDDEKVVRHPFTWRYLSPFLPSDGGFQGFIYESLTRVSGFTTLRDRPVVLLEDISPVPPVVKRAPNEREPDHFVANTYAAIDTQTRQLIQARRVITYITGKYSGLQATNTYDLVVDEMKDLNEYPPDFFTFKAPADKSVTLYIDNGFFYSMPDKKAKGIVLAPGSQVPLTATILPAATVVIPNTSLDQQLSP